MLLCNLKPAKMRGVLSQAMVMCASSPEKVELLDPPSGAVPGDRITFEGFPGNITTVIVVGRDRITSNLIYKYPYGHSCV